MRSARKEPRKLTLSRSGLRRAVSLVEDGAGVRVTRFFYTLGVFKLWAALALADFRQVLGSFVGCWGYSWADC